MLRGIGFDLKINKLTDLSRESATDKISLHTMFLVNSKAIDHN